MLACGKVPLQPCKVIAAKGKAVGKTVSEILIVWFTIKLPHEFDIVNFLVTTIGHVPLFVSI